jgi:chemotaxis-related protein WspB
VPVAQVVVVVPRVALRPIPHAPPYLAGLFNLGGALVPVVDLGLRLGGEPCRPLMSTRILIVEERSGRRLGLVAERVTELRQVPDDLFTSGGAPPPDAPYLGPIAPLEGELVQKILAEEILPESLRATLFKSMLGRS